MQIERGSVYEGTEPYIFVSYAHKDSEKILPLIAGMQQSGFRVWYDAGIEAGTEWPQYIAEHLIKSNCVIAFISKAAADSQNCRREINYAIAKDKPMLAIYLEEVQLPEGMEMQLGTLQAMFYYRHKNDEPFLKALCEAGMLKVCRITGAGEDKTVKESPVTKQEVKEQIPQKKKMWKETLSKLLEREPDWKLIFDYVDEGDSITIIRVKDRNCTEINIPEKIEGKTVRKIGRRAFDSCGQLLSVTMPDSITVIEDDAFIACKRLVNIKLPKELEDLQCCVFERCRSLREITIPERITCIRVGTFGDCSSLERVVLPEGVTKIGWGAFLRCENLTSINLPESLMEIEASGFADCTKLKTMPLPLRFEPMRKEIFTRMGALGEF